MTRRTTVAATLASIATVLALGASSPAQASFHHLVIHSERAQAAASCVYPDGTVPVGIPGLHCYDPEAFFEAYGIAQLHQLGLTGKGQTIILADSFGSPTAQQDLDHFSDIFGLPHTTIRFIYPNGVYVNPVDDSDHIGWAEETTLDLQWAHAIAPDATIVNIVTNTSETTGLAGFPELFKGIQTAAEEYPGAILSMSFGTGEPTFTGDDVRSYIMGSFHKTFEAATAAGMSLLASTGDSGSTNANESNSSLIAYANAGYPASDPLVTAVGGTALESGWTWNPDGTADDFWRCRVDGTVPCSHDFLRSTLTPGSRIETAWKEDWAIAGGGGGVSALFKAPDYQSALPREVRGASGHRVLPDVSLNAAINGGVMVFQSFPASAKAKAAPLWMSTGGTSCASPETAALIALAGQKASELAGKPVSIGYLNPLVYALPDDDFNDIVAHKFGEAQQVTVGDNSLYFNLSALALVGPSKMPPVAVPGFAALPGFDLATGRGTPRAERFVLDLAQARVRALAPTRLP